MDDIFNSVALVKIGYSNTDLCKSESSQTEERRPHPCDSSKAAKLEL